MHWLFFILSLSPSIYPSFSAILYLSFCLPFSHFSLPFSLITLTLSLYTAICLSPPDPNFSLAKVLEYFVSLLTETSFIFVFLNCFGYFIYVFLLRLSSKILCCVRSFFELFRTFLSFLSLLSLIIFCKPQEFQLPTVSLSVEVKLRSVKGYKEFVQAFIFYSFFSFRLKFSPKPIKEFFCPKTKSSIRFHLHESQRELHWNNPYLIWSSSIKWFTFVICWSFDLKQIFFILNTNTIILRY